MNERNLPTEGNAERWEGEEEEEDEDNSVIRCVCGLNADRGCMICCDECEVWQHTDCVKLDEKNLPDDYLCEWCDAEGFYARTGRLPLLPPPNHPHYDDVFNIRQRYASEVGGIERGTRRNFPGKRKRIEEKKTPGRKVKMARDEDDLVASALLTLQEPSRSDKEKMSREDRKIQQYLRQFEQLEADKFDKKPAKRRRENGSDTEELSGFDSQDIHHNEKEQSFEPPLQANADKKPSEMKMKFGKKAWIMARHEEEEKEKVVTPLLPVEDSAPPTITPLKKKLISDSSLPAISSPLTSRLVEPTNAPMSPGNVPSGVLLPQKDSSLPQTDEGASSAIPTLLPPNDFEQPSDHPKPANSRPDSPTVSAENPLVSEIEAVPVKAEPPIPQHFSTPIKCGDSSLPNLVTTESNSGLTPKTSLDFGVEPLESGRKNVVASTDLNAPVATAEDTPVNSHSHGGLGEEETAESVSTKKLSLSEYRKRKKEVSISSPRPSISFPAGQRPSTPTLPHAAPTPGVNEVPVIPTTPNVPVGENSSSFLHTPTKPHSVSNLATPSSLPFTPVATGAPSTPVPSSFPLTPMQETGSSGMNATPQPLNAPQPGAGVGGMTPFAAPVPAMSNPLPSSSAAPLQSHPNTFPVSPVRSSVLPEISFFDDIWRPLGTLCFSSFSSTGRAELAKLSQKMVALVGDLELSEKERNESAKSKLQRAELEFQEFVLQEKEERRLLKARKDRLKNRAVNNVSCQTSIPLKPEAEKVDEGSNTTLKHVVSVASQASTIEESRSRGLDNASPPTSLSPARERRTARERSKQLSEQNEGLEDTNQQHLAFLVQSILKHQHQQPASADAFSSAPLAQMDLSNLNLLECFSGQNQPPFKIPGAFFSAEEALEVGTSSTNGVLLTKEEMVSRLHRLKTVSRNQPLQPPLSTLPPPAVAPPAFNPSQPNSLPNTTTAPNAALPPPVHNPSPFPAQKQPSKSIPPPPTGPPVPFSHV
eukprot:GCRY01006070.1.p1 GENE.GCRY01006070.1~~GCRY01006070.1.p1  ORF type:complete len:987 (+),score=175.96 GCRY01006070.1:116-3076(+)